jgi:hypothetical protein
MTVSVNIRLDELNKFARTFSEAGWKVKVGVMGSKATKKHSGSTNAAIAIAHEFGSFEKHIPARSFLRMPLFVKTAKIITTVGARALGYLLKGNKKSIFIELGITCEAIIQEAFNSGGFGFWLPRKIYGDGHPLLWKTAQLRRSVSSTVTK